MCHILKVGWDPRIGFKMKTYLENCLIMSGLSGLVNPLYIVVDYVA